METGIYAMELTKTACTKDERVNGASSLPSSISMTFVSSPWKIS